MIDRIGGLIQNSIRDDQTHKFAIRFLFESRCYVLLLVDHLSPGTTAGTEAEGDGERHRSSSQAMFLTIKVTPFQLAHG